MWNRKNHKKWIHQLAWILFIIYIACMAYFLFFSEDLNRTRGNYEYNLILFKEIQRGIWCYTHGIKPYFFLNVIMNVAAFIPFGFILPIISPRKPKFINILVSGFELTLVIETIQLLLKVGCFDVDDMLLNTVGAVMGYFLLVLCKHFDSRRIKKQKGE
ncbi:MAG: VanZ family protein [Acetivibrio sp.]